MELAMNTTTQYPLTFEEEELVLVQNECDRYGYKATLQFGEIHIRTKFESWFFIPNENGCIKLMHANRLTRGYQTYHKQFSRKMSYFELVTYLYEHEAAKYQGKHIEFTFTKRGTKRSSFR